MKHMRIVELANAVDGKVADVAEIRNLLASDLTSTRERNSARIGELLAGIDRSAAKLAVEPHCLLDLVSAMVDRRAASLHCPPEIEEKLRGREAKALKRERDAHRALTAAQQELTAATLSRVQAQSRCIAFGVPVQQ